MCSSLSASAQHLICPPRPPKVLERIYVRMGSSGRARRAAACVLRGHAQLWCLVWELARHRTVCSSAAAGVPARRVEQRDSNPRKLPHMLCAGCVFLRSSARTISHDSLVPSCSQCERICLNPIVKNGICLNPIVKHGIGLNPIVKHCTFSERFPVRSSVFPLCGSGRVCGVGGVQDLYWMNRPAEKDKFRAVVDNPVPQVRLAPRLNASSHLAVLPRPPESAMTGCGRRLRSRAGLWGAASAAHTPPGRTSPGPEALLRRGAGQRRQGSRSNGPHAVSIGWLWGAPARRGSAVLDRNQKAGIQGYDDRATVRSLSGG